MHETSERLKKSLCDNSHVVTVLLGQSCKRTFPKKSIKSFDMHVYVSVLLLSLKITRAPVSLDGLLGEGDRL